MNVGIVIFPQKNVQDIINSYRKRYDAHYTLIPPHITLIEKFTVKEQEINQLVNILESISKETPALTVHLKQVRHFYPVTNTIYLAIEHSKPLVELHEKLKQKIKSNHSPPEFIPHITIGQKLSDEELHDVYASLKMKSFHIETKMDRFHLVYQLDNLSWNVYQSFQLLHLPNNLNRNCTASPF